jgi:hypothetical protein
MPAVLSDLVLGGATVTALLLCGGSGSLCTRLIGLEGTSNPVESHTVSGFLWVVCSPDCKLHATTNHATTPHQVPAS